jgi:hypothetical protein
MAPETARTTPPPTLARNSLEQGQPTPVSVKIRRFEGIPETVAYARMLQGAGAWLVGVHGRTRQQVGDPATSSDVGAMRAPPLTDAHPHPQPHPLTSASGGVECARWGTVAA